MREDEAMANHTTISDDEEDEIPVTARDTITKRLREYRQSRVGGSSEAAVPAPEAGRSTGGARPGAATVVEELVDLTEVEEPQIVNLNEAEGPVE